MIVGDRGQNPGLFQTHLGHQVQVLLNRPYPSGYLRIFIPFGKAGLQRLPVLIRVQEELGLTNNPVWAGQAVKHLEYHFDLLDRIGGPGLLAVPKGGIRYEYIVSRVDRQELVVEIDARDLIVWKNIPHQVGFVQILNFESV